VREGAAAGELVLVTGGVRSGKSAFAERLAASYGVPVLYVATAEAGDAEMAARIAAHQARRPSSWTTLEAPLEPAEAVRAMGSGRYVVLLDCLAMLVSNVLLAERKGGGAAPRLERVVAELGELVRVSQRRLIVVTAEVGLGFLPLSPVARTYLDLLGAANQRLAHAAARVYLVVAGIPVDLRALGGATGDQGGEPDPA
jgi:adenosylcobinamide kinase/adenosylcobinamide-phosphate guanylyltransferase